MTTKPVTYRLPTEMLERLDALRLKLHTLPEYMFINLNKHDVLRLVLDEGIAELTFRIMMQDEIAESKPRLLAPVA